MADRIPKNSLNAGELSDRLDGRSDLQKYHSGMRKAENVNILREGGVHGRAGFTLCGEVGTAGEVNVRLEGFNVKLARNDLESTGVHLEFTANLLRIWSEGVLLPVAITTPYGDDEIDNLDFAQKNTLIVITHPDHPPQALQNFEEGIWTLTEIEWLKRPWEPFITTGHEVLLDPNGIPQNNGMTHSTLTVRVDPVFRAVHVGRHLRLVYQTGQVQASTSIYEIWYPYDGEPNDVMEEFHGNSTYESINNPKPVTRPTRCHANEGSLRNVYRCLVDYPGGGHQNDEPSDYPDNFALGVIAIGSTAVAGPWEFETTGRWAGTWVIERSFNGGQTWEQVASVTSAEEGENNELVSGEQTQTNPAHYRIMLTQTNPNNAYQDPVTFRVLAGSVQDEVEIIAVPDSVVTPEEPDGPLVHTCTVEHTPAAFTNQWTATWGIDSWNPSLGYPIATTFHETRLWFGGTKADPERLWASRSDDFYNFEFDTLADSAFTKPLNSDRYGGIVWLVSQRHLLIGTTSAEWTSFSQEGGLLTPEDSNFITHTYHGSDARPSQILSDAAVFVQKQGRKIREFSPTETGLGIYASPDLTELAEQITVSGIKKIARRASPETELFALRNDGQLGTMVFERTQNLFAWGRWVTEGTILSVSSSIGKGEEGTVMIAVRRNFNGYDRTFVEMLHEDSMRAEENDDYDNFVYLDHAIRFPRTQSPYSEVDVGTDYNGFEFTVCADGRDVGQFTVTDGKISGFPPADVVVVGLRYAPEVEPMAPDVYGTGNKLLSNAAHIRVKNSVSLEFSSTERKAWNTEVFSKDRPVSTAKVVTIPGFSGQGQSIVIRQSKAEPFTVQAIDFNTNTGDR